jgi:hypothetical protein
MTTAFVEVVEAGQCSSYPHLMDALHRSLRRNHFNQRPMLSASQVTGTALLRLTILAKSRDNARFTDVVTSKSDVVDGSTVSDSPLPSARSQQPFNLQRGFALVDCHPNVNPQVSAQCRTRRATLLRHRAAGTRRRIKCDIIGGAMARQPRVRLRNGSVRGLEYAVQIGRQMRRRKKPRRNEQAFGGSGGLGGLIMGGGAALVGLSMLDAMF